MTADSHYAVVTTPDVNGAPHPPVPASKKSMGVGEYLRTRFTSLKPPMEKVPNPITLLGQLNRLQWLNFAVAFATWSWDAFDFFTVSMTLEDLAETFGKSKSDITWGISITLMFRSVGSIIFGIAADRYGRKWPFVVNNIMFIVFELATGFCTTFNQFMVVRAFFGVAMGGIWGNAVATALEDAPPEARGIISGILQQGYAFGYLMATVFSRALVNTTSHGWRPLFWFGACPPVLIIAFRMCLPETNVYLERERLRNASSNATATFIAEGKIVIQKNFFRLVYLVLFMAGMSFTSHGSQDLYPTLLKNTNLFNADQVTAVQVTANIGAIVGGTLVGYYSQVIGRRLSLLLVYIGGACLLYPYTHTRTMGVAAVAFFFQACIQGAFGVVPIYLMELSPPKYSTFIAGTAYQLGNLISSTSTTIEAKLGEKYPLPPTPAGKERYDYGKVILTLMAIVYSYLVVLVLLGPEKRGQEFDAAHDEDLGGAAREALLLENLEKNSTTRDHDKEKANHA